MSMRRPNVRSLLSAFSAAVLLSTGLTHPARAQTPQMTSEEQAAVHLVQDWFAAWNTGDATKVASFLSPSVVFQSSMISPACQGPAPIMARYKRIMARISKVSDVRAFAVGERRAGKVPPGWGVVVLTSRIDTLTNRTPTPGDIRVSGLFIVVDGKIQEFWEEPSQRRAPNAPPQTCEDGL